MKIDLLIHNIGELLTLAGPERPRTGAGMNDVGLLRGAAVAVQDGRVVETGSDADLMARYTPERTLDARGGVVMPGFVDPHTHPVFVHTRENEFEMRIQGRSYVEISQSGGGIRSSIRAVREASEDELCALAEGRIRRMIAQGTTTLEAKSGYGLTTQSELKMLRVIDRLRRELPIDIVSTFMGAHEYPEEYKNDHEAYLRILCDEMLPAVVEQNLAAYCDIFTEAHVFSIAESRRVLLRAKELGLRLRMHADEIEPIGGAQLAAEVGAISADHLGAADDEGIGAMSRAGVIATLLPGTIFSLGLPRYARAREMISAGVPVALATDYNPGSCNCDSMPFIISIACIHMKMTVAEAICAATVNAAWALEMGDRVGSLVPGKLADVQVFDMPSYRFLPYHIGSSHLRAVLKAGQVIWEAQA